MQLELVKATLAQQPILANLLELCSYDLTKFCNFDIGDDGFYGYKYLPLYWIEPNRFPYLIYVNDKIAGFILLQQGSPITDDKIVWDVAEFFIMQRYKRHGVGTAAAFKLWQQFKGRWQVRVWANNSVACSFWSQAIQKFISVVPNRIEVDIKGEDWIVYTFESKGTKELSTLHTIV